MKFKGQVSKLWILAIVALNIGIIIMMVVNGLTGVTYVLFPVLVLMDLMVCPALFITDVEIGKKVFTIRYGFTTKTFLIEDITSVTKTDALFGTYAVGTDKISLKKKNQEEIIVSLEDNKGFVNELKKQNKKLKIYI